MKSLAEKVAKRTGLSKTECDAIITIVMHEIISDLRNREEVVIKDFGKIKRKVRGTLSRTLFVTLTYEALARLTAPYKDEERNDEISFE